MVENVIKVAISTEPFTNSFLYGRTFANFPFPSLHQQRTMQSPGPGLIVTTLTTSY